MKIKTIITSTGLNGFAHKDLAAIKTGVAPNGFFYDGDPVTPGFSAVSQTGYVLSLMLHLEDGSIAHGDCLDVIFAGAAGRDPLFNPSEHRAAVEEVIIPALQDQDVSSFRSLAEKLDRLQYEGRPLHTALRYGLSQALLHATSIARRCTMAQVVAEEYGTTLGNQLVPILISIPKTDPFVLDRMIMKRIEILPHASFTVVEADLGNDGGKLIDYARQLAQRIGEIGTEGYRPRIHLDTYGTIGELFENNVADITAYLEKVQQAAAPYELIIESPIIASTMDAQISLYRNLREEISRRGLGVKLVVDEWCNTLEDIRKFGAANATDYVQIKAPDLGGLTNTIEAINYCREIGLGCCLGGTANETDQSSRITTHVGLACGPDFLLGKPGLGGDAALMIMRNEMSRAIALHEAFSGGSR
jgi:methylaspartate ammonia-lyase